MNYHRTLLTLVVCCGLGLMVGGCENRKDDVGLMDAQLKAIVQPGLHTCEAASIETTAGRISSSKVNPDTIVPAADIQEFSVDRVSRTLHGVWRGEVEGDHGEINVDYFWIIDTKASEGLIIAQRSGRQTLADAEPLKNAPTFSFLMCGHEGYSPGTSKPQMHVFTKVSNSTEDAAMIVQKATGVAVDQARPSMTDLWKGLVESDYFETLNYVAFGGGLFKPLQIEQVHGRKGPAETLLKWDAEYRGGGDTLLEFTPTVPMTGTEMGQFVGTTTSAGDFLVASMGNGDVWTVEVLAGGFYDLSFDSVAIGPMQP